MRVQRVPIDEIRPAAYNPRKELKPGDPTYEKLKQSIKEFDCVEPLVLNERTGNLVGGHQRLNALRDLGYETVDVVVVNLPLEREKALNIALNKISGDWDEPKLAELLQELDEFPDLDVGLTGFDDSEITDLLSRVLEVDSSGGDDDDFDPEAALDTSRPAVTKEGEMIELGRHRLLCGDSSKADDLERVLGGQPVDLLFTDPPYNVDYYGGNRPMPNKTRPKRSRQWSRIYADNLAQGEYAEWLGEVLANVAAVLVSGAAFYIFNGHRQFGPMHLLLERLGLRVSCVITWAKESFAIGYGDYNQQTEFCLYGWKPISGKGAHNWHGPTNESTLWQVHRDPTRAYHHPTQKPLELAERAMRNSSRAGQLVLDTFLGSGSTLIAAERTGRRCVGIEIDPHYCDVVARRWIAFLGEDSAPPELVERYSMQREDGQ